MLTERASPTAPISRATVGEHRIVSSASGDMAYEYGTLHMSSDSKSNQATGHEEFDAVMLIVYKAKTVFARRSLTMQPLEKKARALNTPAKRQAL